MLIFVKLIPTSDPWSSMSSHRVHFNDNETLQCPEESPDEQHIRVVIPSNSFEGSYGGAGLRVGQGDGEAETREGASRGRSRLGGRRGDGGQGQVEDRNWRSNISKMSIMVTAQTTATTIGYHSCNHDQFLTRVFLDSILVIDLVDYLCCMIAIFLIHKKPHVAKILGGIGYTAIAFGFILLTIMSLVCTR